ncbi:MAG: pilus assembly protein PilM, partial [Planctomycetota bacterium]|nr:pilus assembly protein PilM [Planctomycetota bacterium]
PPSGDQDSGAEVPPAADALTASPPPLPPPISRDQAPAEPPAGDAQPTVLTAAPSFSAPPSTRSELGPVLRPSASGPETTEDRRKRQMSMALVREAAALCAALENVVLLAKQQNKLRDLKVDRVYLTGGGSRLKGLQEFLSRRLRVEVMPLEPFRQLSLKRLAPEQAEALKAEQHTLAMAAGLALGDLHKGALSFLLWPDALRQRKTFWARGAYLYYAAALLVLAAALFLFTPYRNTQVLRRNFDFAENAFNEGQTENAELRKLEMENEERRNQLKQIADNTLSGHFFLNLLAELKSTNRIPDDIYLTQISTSMPQVVYKAAANETNTPEKGGAPPPPTPNAPEPSASSETFQMRRVVYLRGFVRATENDAGMILKIKDFYSRRLVPFPDDPDNPANLFKDVRPIWFSTEDYKHGQFYLTEFVLEAYTEGTREKQPKKAGASATTTTATTARRTIGAEAGPAPVAPAAVQPAPVAPAVVQPAPVAPVVVQPAPVAPVVVQPAPAAPTVVKPAPAEPDGGDRPQVRKKFIVPDTPPKAAPDAPAKAGAPDAAGKKE